MIMSDFCLKAHYLAEKHNFDYINKMCLLNVFEIYSYCSFKVDERYHVLPLNLPFQDAFFSYCLHV